MGVGRSGIVECGRTIAEEDGALCIGGIERGERFGRLRRANVLGALRNGHKWNDAGDFF
jgi:hypothetical protein